MSEGRTRNRFRPRRWQLALAALLVLSAAAAVAAVLSESAGASPHVVPNSLVRIDPSTDKIVSDTPIGPDPWPIVLTQQAIWTIDFGQNGSNAGTNIARYDLRTHKVQKLGQLVPQPFGIAADGKGNLWVSSFASNVTRLAFGSRGAPAGQLHPSSRSIPLPPPGAGLVALGPGYLWVIAGPITTPGTDDRVWLVDRATNTLVRPLRTGHATTSIAFGYGAAWIGGFGNERPTSSGCAPCTASSWLTVIRAAPTHPQSYRLEAGVSGGPDTVAVGFHRVWILTVGPVPAGQQILEFDPNKRKVVNDIPLTGREPNGLAIGADSIWLTDQIDASVTQLDPRTGHILRTIPVGEPRTAAICGIAATRNAVWVTIGGHACVNSGP